MSSKAQVKASKKYDKEHTRSVMLKFNLTGDADILSKLDAVSNKQGYIKNLVRQDIRGDGECLPIDAIRILLLPVAKKYGLRRVFLFGSYARGEAKPESDIDLLIEEGDLGTAAKFLDLVDTLETRLGKPVDIVTANKAYSDSSRAGKRLLRNIERDKVLVYEGA